MLFGFEIFYRSLENSLKSKNEAIVIIFHYILINEGFKCIGCSEEVPDNIIESELLPTNWNSNDYFILHYINSKTKDKLLIKIIPSENILLINALFKKNDIIAALTIDPNQYINDNFKNYKELFVNGNSLEKLISEIKNEIFDKIKNKKNSLPNSKNDSEPIQTRSFLKEENSNPNFNLNNPNIANGGFPVIGRADLDPLGRGIGGGMILDLQRLQNYNPRYSNYPQNPLSRFNSSSGLSEPLPPGAVPPGARFDFIGPPELNTNNYSNQNRRGRNHPDLEPYPDDYDNMFM